MIMLALMLFAGGTGANTPALGDWIGPTKSVVRVYDCGAAVCLKIVKLPPDAPGTTDDHNPDAALKGRQLCGANIGTGFMPAADGKLEGGKLYDPTSGKTYSGTLTPAGDKLKLRGYLGISLFGRSETWTRVPTVAACK